MFKKARVSGNSGHSLVTFSPTFAQKRLEVGENVTQSHRQSAATFLRELRLTYAQQLLQESKGKIAIAHLAQESGYKNASKFCAALKNATCADG